MLKKIDFATIDIDAEAGAEVISLFCLNYYLI